jgi:iron complex outermembrane receptor protein
MRNRGLAPIVTLIAASLFGAPDLAAQEPGENAQAGALVEETLPEGETPPAPADPNQAPAQQAPQPPAPAKAPVRPGIEEIVIQAGESEAAADYQAADSVTAFDASDLEALGAQTIEDLASYTPNLEIVTAGATTPTFFIRGVGLNDFNANSSGAVALYQDDVPINAPALQLGTLFDMEAVNVLRGPQGTGLARNASAGAIKLYTRKPSGEYGSFLRSDFGNYGYMDFEGAVEAPVYEDLLSSRFAFRWTRRDGFGTNRCAGAVDDVAGTVTPQGNPDSYCGENDHAANIIPPGLAEEVNDLGNWAARGTLRFNPTLDMEWLLGAHGARRDEQSRLGQSIGTDSFTCAGDVGCSRLSPEAIEGSLGGQDGGDYQPQEVRAAIRAIQLPAEAACDAQFPRGSAARQDCKEAARSRARNEVASQLAETPLDDEPYAGDYDKVGPTRNDTWGGYLRGELALPKGLSLTSVSGYDGYDRLIDIDLDFSPNKLFEIKTQDRGWQATQDLTLAGQLSELPLRWELGGYYLMENLQVHIDNDFGAANFASVATRDYTQKLWSAAGYASLEWDFWENFTLDGGFRYNWERKTIDYALERGEEGTGALTDFQEATWQAPTGTVRLTYRFREDTHAYWKYTRGWKGGHYNATSSLIEGVTSAEPETIDAFETGLRGGWFEGRLGLDLSIFYYSYQNYQLFTIKNDFGALPEFVVINANDAEVYGSEIDLVARPLPGTFLNARFGWIESRFLDFVQEQIVQESNNVIFRKELNHTGNRLLNSPRFKLSVTAEQTVPLGRFGSLTARYDGAWTADNYFDPTEGLGIPNRQGILFLPENTIGQPSYWLHNLWLGYRPPQGNVVIAGWVRNLTDEVYKTFAFDASTFNETTIHFTGVPRTYGMSFVVNF